MAISADPTTNPAGFVLEVCDGRERKAKAAAAKRPGPYYAGAAGSVVAYGGKYVTGYTTESGSEVAEHIAAEANPDAVLADVALWRGVVERHRSFEPRFGGGPSPRCSWCLTHPEERISWPCPDLTAVVTAAQAYVGGTA